MTLWDEAGKQDHRWWSDKEVHQRAAGWLFRRRRRPSISIELRSVQIQKEREFGTKFDPVQSVERTRRG